MPVESTTTSSTATTLDPSAYAVPETIDQAYVQKVVSAYDRVLGDAIRVLKRDGRLSDDFLKRLLAIYTQPQFEFQQQVWAEAVRQGDLDKRPEVPGDPRTRVVSVLRADGRCVIAEIDRDFSPTLTPGVAPEPSPEADYIVLVAKLGRPDPLEANPTPWVMAFDGYLPGNRAPLNSCDD